VQCEAVLAKQAQLHSLVSQQRQMQLQAQQENSLFHAGVVQMPKAIHRRSLPVTAMVVLH
jgi:hypothetical protein